MHILIIAYIYIKHIEGNWTKLKPRPDHLTMINGAQIQCQFPRISFFLQWTGAEWCSSFVRFRFSTPLFIFEEIIRQNGVTPEKVQCTACERNAMANSGKISKGLKSHPHIQRYTSVPLLLRMQRWQTMM